MGPLWCAGDRSLVQGLKGDATYLVVNEKSELENYGINGARAIAPALRAYAWHVGGMHAVYA